MEGLEWEDSDGKFQSFDTYDDLSDENKAHVDNGDWAWAGMTSDGYTTTDAVEITAKSPLAEAVKNAEEKAVENWLLSDSPRYGGRNLSQVKQQARARAEDEYWKSQSDEVLGHRAKYLIDIGYWDDLVGIGSAQARGSMTPLNTELEIIMLVYGAGALRFRGGQTFSQYKKANGGGGLIGEIPLNNPHKYYGSTFPVRVEYSHRWITQATQRKYNLPNWLVNNRINVIKTNTLRHSAHDPFRYRFLPREIKLRLGPGGDLNYNMFGR